MPKIRTRKGISKRIRVTRNGKLIRAHAWKSHLLQGKSAKRKRRLSAPAPVSPADSRAIRRALGV
jgi:large subunit ribosomal protein L35